MNKPGPKPKQLNDDRIKALAGQISDKALARIVGCHKETVQKRRHALGIPGSLKHYDWPRIFELVQSGTPVRAAAVQTGHTSKYDLIVIYRKLREKGIIYNKRTLHIPDPTPIQVQQLIEFYRLPRKYAAKLMGVSVKTVKKWRERYNRGELRSQGNTAR